MCLCVCVFACVCVCVCVVIGGGGICIAFFVHALCGWSVNTYGKTSVSRFDAYAKGPDRLCVASFTF